MFVCCITVEQCMNNNNHGAASPGSWSIVCLWGEFVYQPIVVYRPGNHFPIEAVIVV